MGAEQKFSNGLVDRRDFLIGTASLAILACTGSIAETVQSPEQDAGPKMGEIIIVGRQAFWLRNKRTYQIPDLPRFLRNIKADKYGHKPKDLPSIKSVIDQFPLTALSKEEGVFDRFTGDVKDAKKSGGEINLLYGGSMTRDTIPSNGLIRPNETFLAITNDLKSEGDFDFRDTLFFPYGKDSNKTYDARDTIIDPKINIDNSIAHLEGVMIDFPFAQINGFGHSLGGIFLLAAAMKHPEVFNNLVFFSSPVRGIEGTLLRRFILQLAKQNFPFLADEKVSEFLFERWDSKGGSKDFQKNLDDFGQSFTKSGKKIIIVTAADDPFIPTESTMIKGARQIILPASKKPLLPDQLHGRTLTDEEGRKPTVQAIGKNLART